MRAETELVDERSETESGAVGAISNALRQRFGSSLVGLIYYGAALRAESPRRDAILDVFAVVDGYRRAHGSILRAAVNAVLPPNVYFVAADVPGADTVRAKCNLVSIGALERRTTAASFEPWFWGRLAQPTRLDAIRDEPARQRLQAALAAARYTILDAARTLASGPIMALDLWALALTASYRTEFRAERKAERAASIVAQAPTWFEEQARQWAVDRGIAAREADGGLELVVDLGTARRRLARVAWGGRRFHGRCLHVLRLVKGAFTVEGGLEYLLWKIARHSGVSVEATAAERRFPLLLGWKALLRARRRGGFR